MAQITLVFHITAKRETRLLVRDELMRIASQTRKEEGNINYFVHISPDNDRVFMIYENWKNQAALDEHMKQPYLAEFLDKAAQWLDGPVEEKQYSIL
jgi:quinol monooxygenase YgiN